MKKLTTTMVAACVGLASASANAVLITDWTYTNEAGFFTSSPDAVIEGGTPTNAGIGIDGLPTMLSWGAGSRGGDPSSLVIDGAIVDGLVETDGDEVIGTGLVHNNNPIQLGGDFLETTLILDALQLTATAPVVASPVMAPTLQFAVLFDETQNSSDSANCKYLAGNDEVNTDGCADLFTILIPDVADFEVVDGDLLFSVGLMLDDPDNLGLDEYMYTVTTRLSGLDVVDFSSAPECSELSGINCFGFLTTENFSNRLDANFSITAARVTEPGTLAIFGLGLLGLAGARRRS